MTFTTLGLLAVFAPAVVAVVLIVVAPLRRTGKPAAYASIAAAATSFVASGAMLSRVDPHHPLVAEVSWLPRELGNLATIGLHLDGVSVPMLTVVSLVALCVQVFSLAYMADEDNAGFGRYFTWHSLFLFAMQALVVAPNLLQLFVAWELVGLCSYLLIGFYYRKPSAARAAVKAFWMTKFADMGLLIGLVVQYSTIGSFAFDDTAGLALGSTATVVAALYFLAVMGKSAQFPLHIWLPDAMEGPTPVSALLHAATMVAAGVYLVVRAFPIFEMAPGVLAGMAIIGSFTALFAACVAVVQTDIKKVLAYSTCSQLGYMIAALGAGNMMAGYFHLTTHAFFKALLFLAAGSIIHAVHSNDLKDMGGLARRMPVTAAVFFVGAGALSGLPFLSGFYSKDLILETLIHAARHDPVYIIAYGACGVAAFLTAFYMGRVAFAVFLGPDTDSSKHAHEGSLLMQVPLIVLALFSVMTGFAGGWLGHLWGAEHFHFDPLHISPVAIAASVLAFGGLGGAVWWVFRLGNPDPATSFGLLGKVATSGAVDDLWVAGYRGGVLVVARGVAWFDRYIIDGLMNAVGAGALVLGERIRETQSGRVDQYVFVVVVSVLALAAWSQVVSL